MRSERKLKGERERESPAAGCVTECVTKCVTEWTRAADRLCRPAQVASIQEQAALQLHALNIKE